MDEGYKNSAGEWIGANNGEFDWEGKEQNVIFGPGIRSEEFLDVSQGSDEFKRGNEIISSDGRGWPCTEEHIQAQISRANIAWAQAGIQFNVVGIYEFDPAIMGAPSIWQDLIFQMPGKITSRDLSILYTYLKYDIDEYGQSKPSERLNRKDVIYIVYEPCKIEESQTLYDKVHNKKFIIADGFSGFPSSPQCIHPFWGDNPEFMAFIKADTPLKGRALAHEIGHLLDRKGDDKTKTQSWWFYPSWTTIESRNDHKINNCRRTTNRTRQFCRNEGLKVTHILKRR